MNFWIADKPGPPRDLAVTDFSESTVSVKWVEPEDDGGTEVTGYVLEKRDITRSAWSNAMSTQELEFTIPKLVKDKQYLIRVAAENACGVGPFVELEKPVTAKCPFGKCSCKASVVEVKSLVQRL